MLTAPEELDLLHNAVRVPVRQMISVEVGGAQHGETVARQLREWAGPQRAVVEITFDAHTDEPGDIMHRCRDATPGWKNLEPPGLLILRDMTPPDVTPPASVARKSGITPHTVLFWRGANMLRENWDDLGAQLVFLVTPQQYQLFTTEADHLRSWIALKLHLSTPAWAAVPVPPTERIFLSTADLRVAGIEDEDQETARQDRDILRRQLDEATVRGEPMATRLSRYCVPLFSALIALGEWDSAQRLNSLIAENEALLRPADRLRWLRLRSDLEVGTGQVEDAIATAEEQIAFARASHPPFIARKYSLEEALLSYAMLLYNLGRHENAEVAFKELVELAPEEAGALNNYAFFLFSARRDYERAEELYKRALELEPKNTFVLTNYANLLWQARQDYDRAEELYQTSIQINPNYAGSLGAYAAFLQYVRKDYEQAESFFKRAIQSEPKNAINLVNYALLLVDRQRDYNQVESLFNLAIELEPHNSNILGHYADFLYRVKKDYEQAEEFFERSISFNQENTNFLDAYAVFLWQVRQDYQKAEEFYLRAVETDPTHANTLGNYAQFLFAQGRYDEGKAMLERAEAAEGNERALQIEIAFYRYAHLWQESPDALAKLKTLLQNGARSPGWDLAANVERAEQDGHPNGTLLRALAEVIFDKAPLESLDTFEKWRAV